MATCSSILAWKIPWTEELGGLQSMGSQRVRHDWVTEHAHKQLYIAPNSGWAMVLCQQSCLWKSFHGPHSRHSPPSPSSPQMVTILSFLLVTSFCLITWMWICRQYSLVSTIKKKKMDLSLWVYSSDSQLWVILTSRGHSSMSRDIFGCCKL